MSLPSRVLAHRLPIDRPALTRALLLLFAFTAWSLTGPANLALALLIALFLADLPAHWDQWRRDPAFRLLLGVFLVTGLLALRAAWLFPATADLQWQGVWAWGSPFLFVVVAWWLSREPDLVWPLMGAAILGLVFGVLRKTDWSLLPQVLEGMRYHFGQAALGLAFIASVMLAGMLLLRRRITGLRLAGRTRPVLGWTLWLLGCAALLTVLVVTQSRGAALGLALAGGVYGLILALGGPAKAGLSPRQAQMALGSAVLFIALSMALLWATKGRQVQDWQELTVGSPGNELSYTGSIAIRLNLLEVGLRVFAERPWLGFGPGTSTTEFLIPQGLVQVGDYHQTHAPGFSHLHSVAVETLTRFGLLGLLIGALLLWLLGRAYGRLWSRPDMAPDLRTLLTLGGLMLMFYCLYDFRLVNQDLRFFIILFLGIVYGLSLVEPARSRGDGA